MKKPKLLPKKAVKKVVKKTKKKVVKYVPPKAATPKALGLSPIPSETEEGFDDTEYPEFLDELEIDKEDEDSALEGFPGDK